MAHPMAGQAKASQKRRLSALGAKAGKSWGSSSMYKKTGYPSTHAGSSTPMTISGGSSKKRPDRFAFGGAVGGGKKKRHSGNTTNIIISHAGGRGGSGGGGGGGARPPGVGAVPVPVPRPVPVPVGGAPAGPGPGLPGAAPVARPALPVGGGAPVAGPAPMPMRPPLPAGPPPGAMPMRPPGMKAGGAVKKRALGGDTEGEPSDFKKGGAVARKSSGGGVKKLADGGGPGITVTKKLQIGGGTSFGGSPMGGGGLGGAGQGNVGSPGGSGLMGLFPGRQPVPPQQGATNLSGRQMIPFQQPVTVPMSRMGTSALTRPAPGTTPTYAKKGGKIPHADEAEDKKLIKKMIAKEDKAEKRASGGLIGPKYKDWGKGQKKSSGGSTSPRLSPSENYHQQGKGFKDGGSTGGISNSTGGAGGGLGRLAKARSAK